MVSRRFRALAVGAWTTEMAATGAYAQSNCELGTVNSGAGPTANVLLVSGRTGTVQLSSGEPFSLTLNAAPSGPSTNARYVLWAWLSCPSNPRTLTVSGQTLGCTVNPTPFHVGQAPQAFRCVRGGLGPEYCIGVTELRSSPAHAPFTLNRNGGLARSGTYTIQGVIDDNGAANTQHLSVTNAVVIQIGENESPPEPPPARPGGCSSCSAAASPVVMGDVALYSGEVRFNAIDLRIPGRGLDFVWCRTYRSRIGPSTAMGNGWDFSYNIRIEREGQNIRVFDGNGRSDVYVLRTNGMYTRREIFHEGQFNPDGTFTLTFEDTGTWNFHALDGGLRSGKIESIVDRNGNTLSFTYSGGRLVTVTDTLGRNIAIGYTADGHIATVTDFANRQVRYAYYSAGSASGSAGDLQSARSPVVVGTPNANDFPTGKTTTYTYSTGFADERRNHNLLTITDPMGQVFLSNVYALTTDCRNRDFDRVIRQRKGNPGDDYKFTYLAETPSTANGQAVARVIVNDRVGNVGEYLYDARNRLVLAREFTGRANRSQPTTDASNRPVNRLRTDDPASFDTLFEYNDDSRITRVTLPNGNVLRNVYEVALDPNAPWRSRGNLRERHRQPGTHVPSGDQNEIVETFQYDLGIGGCCGTNFVTRHVDGRGNLTIHTYDTQGNRLHTQHRIPSILEDFEYNAAGQMISHTWPDNGSNFRRRDVLVYYGPADGCQNGYLRSRTVDSTGRALVTAYQYDCFGNVVRVTDARNHDSQLIVNALNQVVRETSREVTNGSGIRYSKDQYFDANDNLIRLDVENKDENGVLQPNQKFTTTYAFDILNRPIRKTQEVDPSHDVITEHAYDANGNETVVRFGEATNGHDSSNTVATVFDERNLPYRRTRGFGGPAPSTQQTDYDGNRNVRVLRDGIESSPQVTSYTYDGYDRRSDVTDPMGNITQYHYDANGNVGGDQSPGIPNAFGERTRGELNDGPGSSGNVRLSQSSFQYDAMDRLVRRDVPFFDPSGGGAPIGDGLSTTTYEYTAAGQMKRTVDDNIHDTRLVYDTSMQLRQKIDAKGNTITYAYDGNQNVVSMTEVDVSDLGNPSATFITTESYDNLDRVTRVLDPSGNATDYRYDSRHNSTRTIDAQRVTSPTSPGNATIRAYDGLSRVVTTTYPYTDDSTGSGTVIGQITVTTTWDDSSRQTGDSDNTGNRTTYSYDGLDRLIRTSYADSAFETYQYDVHDNVLQLRDANGSVIAASYDLLNGVTSRSITPAAGVSAQTTSETYRYDGLSRVVHAQNDNSLVTRSYDSTWNVAGETTDGLTIRYVYDGVGNQIRATYPDGRTILTTYDALDRIASMTEIGVPNPLVVYNYIGSDRVERRSLRNNTRCVYSYDGAFGVGNPPGDFGVRQMVGLNDVYAGDGTVVDSRTFAWDRMQNKRFRVDVRPGGPGFSHEYSYDSLNRLRRTLVFNGFGGFERQTDYQLDDVGNRQFVSGPGPEAGSYYMDSSPPEPSDSQMNQYTYTPAGSRQYDVNGNLVYGYRSYTYDYRNQLVSVSDPFNGTLATYEYDAFGRRTRQVSNAGGSPQTTRFLYNEWQEIAEFDGTGATQATYLYGNDVDEVLSMRRGGVTYYFHADDLHNVMAVTDGSGAVVERYEYGDFGRPIIMDSNGNQMSTSAIGNPILFNGRRYDADTGLYYYRTRYLDPVAGRFTARDTIGAWGDRENVGNAFTYAGNNPWSRRDPDGQMVVRPVNNTASTPPAPAPLCSADQLERLRSAVDSARVMARHAHFMLTVLGYLGAILDPSYEIWFGGSHRHHYQRVRRTMTDIRDALENTSIPFDCTNASTACRDARPGLRACAGLGDRGGTVWVADGFWDPAEGLPFEHAVRAGLSTAQLQGSIVLHELTHQYGSTQDHSYDVAQCIGFTAGTAVDNASNYQFYALSVMDGSPIVPGARAIYRLAVAEVRREIGRVEGFVRRVVRRIQRVFGGGGHHHHHHHHRRHWNPFR